MLLLSKTKSARGDYSLLTFVERFGYQGKLSPLLFDLFALGYIEEIQVDGIQRIRSTTKGDLWIEQVDVEAEFETFDRSQSSWAIVERLINA